MRRQILRTIAAGAVAILAVACGSSETPKPAAGRGAPANTRSLAEDAERHGDWAGAAKYWETEVQAAPRDRAAALSLVRALRRSNACGRAGAYFDKMRADTPRDTAVLLEAGKCHLVSGRFGAAQAAFEAAVKADGKSWEAESMLGTALDYEDRSSDALIHHDRAVALAPRNAVALSNKGLSLALGGHLDQALAVTRQAATQPGAPARVRANLALLEAVAGNGDVAAMIARQESEPDQETQRLLQRIAAAARK